MAKKQVSKTKRVKKSNSKTKKPKLKSEVKKKKVHPWRMCPTGEHWVRTHPMHTHPSTKHPSGLVTTREGHCASNPSKKDHLYPHEILEMSDRIFVEVTNRPCPIDLGFKNKGDQYNALIAGWVQYWNDIFEPKDPLNPDLVKALIATESGFETDSLANKKDPNSARGLMQVTNKSRKILGDEKGEIKEHFLTVTRNELNDPSINICAGVRWLFHKRKLASSKLKRDATWAEVIQEYKGTSTTTPARAKKIMGKFLEKLQELEKCEKK